MKKTILTLIMLLHPLFALATKGGNYTGQTVYIYLYEKTDDSTPKETIKLKRNITFDYSSEYKKAEFYNSSQQDLLISAKNKSNYYVSKDISTDTLYVTDNLLKAKLQKKP